MRCPFCGFLESKVIDSRATEDGNSIRRRRECLSCAKRFTTYEVVDKQPLMVIKKDGRREMFERNKILNGLLRAFEKRNTSLETLEAIVDGVERQLRNTLDKEIPTTQIGEFVLQQIRDIDQVAYVRFASVYRQFADLDSFIRELDTLRRAHDACKADNSADIEKMNSKGD